MAPYKPQLVFECPGCGVSFTRARTAIKKNKPKFCSISCAAKVQPRRKDFGDGFVDKNGYRLLKRGGKYIPEHRLVMEAVLGRRLSKCETVHHVNGQKLDNSPKNLELWSSKHPSGQRVSDKVRFAIEILRSYPNEARAAGARLFLSLPVGGDYASSLLSEAA